MAYNNEVEKLPAWRSGENAAQAELLIRQVKSSIAAKTPKLKQPVRIGEVLPKVMVEISGRVIS
ncbi:hypothetical protein HYU95_02955, partial [Candidatus Daviesbacteria bacterium]|nr:hypothetical protein [Candidatus Daviesbacteria bacterium]